MISKEILEIMNKLTYVHRLIDEGQKNIEDHKTKLDNEKKRLEENMKQCKATEEKLIELLCGHKNKKGLGK